MAAVLWLECGLPTGLAAAGKGIQRAGWRSQVGCSRVEVIRVAWII